MATRFFKDMKAFANMLTDYQAVVSGRAALHLMSPRKTTHWTPGKLDIYAPEWKPWSYFIVKGGEQEDIPYAFSQIQHHVTFSDGASNSRSRI